MVRVKWGYICDQFKCVILIASPEVFYKSLQRRQDNKDNLYSVPI